MGISFPKFRLEVSAKSKMIEKISFLVCLFVLSSANEIATEKDSRQFSLFSIVTFKNDACAAVSTAGLKGVCMTATECSSSGTADGNCASAFGVCCVIKVSTCGGSVTKNASYIDNPSYPTAYSTTGSCSYTVTRCSTEICQVRLDFFKVVLQQPASTTGSCTNTYTTITPGASGVTAYNRPPTLCGTLTDQHLYIDSGRTTSTIVTIKFTLASASDNYWRIKVSQIPCWSSSRAPPGCLQYFTGVRSTVKSFNWDGTSACSSGCLLREQAYRVCFRPEKGMCGMSYGQTDSESSSVDTFDMTEGATYARSTYTQCSAISNAFIEILTADAQTMDRYCGAYLAQSGDGTNGAKSEGLIYASESNPWNFGVYALSGAAQLQVGGFSITAQQLPCGGAAATQNKDGKIA